MSTQFECEQTLLVQADFDGELDAGQAAGLIAHEKACAHCQLVREQLGRSRALMRAAPRYAASAELRASLAQRLDSGDGALVASVERREDAASAARAFARRNADGDGSAHAAASDAGSSIGAKAAGRIGTPSANGTSAGRVQQSKSWFARSGSLGWGAAIAASAVLATLLLLPRSPDISEQLVSNRLRAMQLDSHLIDVVSTDHHTVKPWFAGKVSFAPLVKQLDSDGYVLKGGRVDIVQGQPAAVLVYQAGRHVVDVYMWPARAGGSAPLQSTSVDGFNLRHWDENDLTVWCVSDLGGTEIDTFVQKWQQR